MSNLVLAWVDGEIVESPARDPVTSIVQSVPLTRIYKSDLFRNMTDAEYEAYKMIRAGFPERLGAVFDGATVISTQDELFPLILQASVAAYGETRAHELLAATE